MLILFISIPLPLPLHLSPKLFFFATAALFPGNELIEMVLLKKHNFLNILLGFVSFGGGSDMIVLVESSTALGLGLYFV